MARQRLSQLQTRGLDRRLQPTASAAGQKVTRNGRTLVSFCSNDYLGLSHDPRVIRAATQAAETYGTGAGASRLVSGDHPELRELETALAAWKGTEAALVFGSGYLANVGAIPVLAEEGDLILIDQLAHACQIAGARLSKARCLPFRHNDIGHFSTLLMMERSKARHCLVITEGVFSMDGDLPYLPTLTAMAEKYDAWTMVDDAHALGVLGGGRGSAHHWGVAVDVQMGTLSKALGSYGGYIAGSREVIDLLVSRASSFIFATGLPPASAAAARESLRILAETPGLSDRPLAKARDFCAAAGLPEPNSHIVPLILGPSARALAASAELEARGFLVTAIRPPTVPEGSARLRLTFAADHLDTDVQRLAEAVRALGLTLGAAA
jgi:8-amino-7-oxononanoate synthase